MKRRPSPRDVPASAVGWWATPLVLFFLLFLLLAPVLPRVLTFVLETLNNIGSG